MLSYKDHYLPDPARSLFPLERRHAEAVLRDTRLPLLSRVKRTRELWLDPTFEAPAEFVSEAIAAADSFDITVLDSHRVRTIEDHHFEVFQLVLARCAPERLANIIRAELRESNVPADARYWRAIHAAEHLILGGPQESTAAHGRWPNRVCMPEDCIADLRDVSSQNSTSIRLFNLNSVIFF